MSLGGILGIASGTDWNAVIDQLVSIEGATRDKLVEQRNDVQRNLDIMKTVNEQLNSFNTQLSNMRFESTFLSRNVESSSSGLVSAVAQPGAAIGSYNIEISQLAKASRASSGLDGEIYNKVVNLSNTNTMGINNLLPYSEFQPTRALANTLIKDTVQAGDGSAKITEGDTITIQGNLKDGTAVSGTFTFNGDGTDTMQRLATTISQTFHGEIVGTVGSNGELVFLDADPDGNNVTFNLTLPGPTFGLQFNDTDYSGSTLDFGIGNEVAAGGATQRVLRNNVVWTNGGSPITNDATLLNAIDGVTALDDGDVITISGSLHDGSLIADHDFTYTAGSADTIADLLAEIETAFGATATATIENGRLVLTDNTSGTSQMSVALSFSDNGSTSDIELGDFQITETGRDNTGQMLTTASFEVEGTGEHRVSSTEGKAGKISGTLTITDPANTLESWGITEYSSFSIDPDGTAGSLGPVTITGMNQYSTVQDLIDAINEQVPTVTAQLKEIGTDQYNFELIANEGGQDFRVFDDASGITQLFGPGVLTDLDTAAGDPYTTAATTNTDDATLVTLFRPDNGGPLQRRVWTGDEGVAVDSLIGGVAIYHGGAGFQDDGVATIVTTNSAELNTKQNMYTYVYGSMDIAADPPIQYPPINASKSLAEAGFAITPENSDTNPLFHTDGFFTINGVRINVGDVNSTTINDVLGAINTSGAGVTAYFDGANQRFYMRSNAPGATDIQFGGGGDTSNFLQITGLTSTAGGTKIAGQQKASVDEDLPLSQAEFTTKPTSGVFTINDVKIAIDAGVDNMQDVIDKINRSGAGVTATYDSVADMFVLRQNLDTDPTALRISIGDAADTSNFLEAVNLTVNTTTPRYIGSTRQTAEFTVNGVAYSRNSNKVDDVVDKLEISLNGLTNGPETISVTADTERIENSVIDFVVEYNKTMELVNGKPLTKEERKYTKDLTDEMAQNMTIEEMEEYIKRQDELLIRDFVSSDSTVRGISRKIQNLVQGMVSNEGPFQSLSQIGLSTAEVGTGPNAVAVNQGRLLAPTSDREVIADLIKTKTDLQNAIRTQSEDLYTLFANVMESQLDHKGSRDMSSGFAVSDQLEFTIGDGNNSATITFAAGSYSQNQLLNKVNQALLQAGMSSSVLAYYDANNQLTIRSTKEEEQAFLEIQDRSIGSDSLQGLIGIQPGLFFGPDPEISGGVAMRSRSYINSITGIGGIVTERIKEQGTFARRIQNYNEAIQRQEEHLANYEYDLRQKFARMETQLGELNNQMQAVEAAISKMNASTGGGSGSGGGSQ